MRVRVRSRALEGSIDLSRLALGAFVASGCSWGGWIGNSIFESGASPTLPVVGGRWVVVAGNLDRVILVGVR